MNVSKPHRILYYHAIAKKPPDIYPLSISYSHFERQIRLLTNLGYREFPLSVAVAESDCLRVKSFSVTFDDGFACNYAPLLSIMNKYKISPTLFIVSKCINNKFLAWNHKLIILRNSVAKPSLEGLMGELLPGANLLNFFDMMPMSQKDDLTDTLWQQLYPISQEEYLFNHKPFLSSEQLAELVAKGAEIGSHSHSHPDFSRLSISEALAEVNASFFSFDVLHLPYERLFAFPYGRSGDAETISELSNKLGLLATFGVNYRRGDNLGTNQHFQRQNMEGSFWKSALKFWLK
ncbi:MAG: polysaccharide deacetylase family protein [Candidatus Cloacimonetes bacterium]|nr:polysaccharide deacetylase family protein [Candidatus Cloacimonadota bacterium]